jgi:hypothetical protein
MKREKSSFSFLRSLIKGHDHGFFKDLTGIIFTVGGTLVAVCFCLTAGYRQSEYVFGRTK